MDPERILVVDDEPNMAWLFSQAFAGDYEIVAASSGEQALELLRCLDIDLIMLDLRLPGADGIDTLRAARKHGFSGPVIVMTAFGEIKTAVAAMKLGAHDYVTKPFDMDELRLTIESSLRLSGEAGKTRHSSRVLDDVVHLRDMITVSPEMLRIFAMVERVSTSDASVLVQGESGTGKELMARAIHYSSPRKNKPFVPVNCAALPESLLESELFGYDEGAFSGAGKRKPGRFEIADGGTILLDEVGDLPLAMQPKILRAAEEKVIERLGGTRRIPVDVRIVAASNRDLRREVNEGRFRQDLYFRLAVITVSIPPLRERKEDILVLASHFLQEFCSDLGRQSPSLSDSTTDALLAYDWPGNVRELKNAMQHLALLCDDSVVEPHSLPDWILLAEPSELARVAGDDPLKAPISLKESRRRAFTETEKRRIVEALRIFDGNRTRAAEYLGISRRSLQLKIKRYGL
ncbi:MAG: sigma-54-dependent transcriptional regulator [Bacillota bacterium]